MHTCTLIHMYSHMCPPGIYSRTHMCMSTHTHTNTMFEEQFTISHVSMGGPADLDQILLLQWGLVVPGRVTRVWLISISLG